MAVGVENTVAVSDSGVDLASESFEEIPSFGSPIELADWRLDYRVRRLKRTLQPPRRSPSVEETWGPQQMLQVSDSPKTLSAKQRPHVAVTESDKLEPRASLKSRGGRFAWVATWLSVATLSCGMVLVARAQMGSRQDLWRVAVPMIVAGQFGLLLGMGFQLFRRG